MAGRAMKTVTGWTYESKIGDGEWVKSKSVRSHRRDNVIHEMGQAASIMGGAGYTVAVRLVEDGEMSVADYGRGDED